MNGETIQSLKMENAKLQAELATARSLLESANSIIIRWDKDGAILYMNDFGLRFFGYSSEELFGQHVMTIVPKVESSSGRDLAKYVQEIAKNPDQYKSVTNENLTKDGRTVWVTWTNKAVFDKQGSVQEVLAIGNDITILKEVEQKRFEYQEKLEAALEAMDDAVFISDLQGNFVHINEAFATFHRHKDKEECLARLEDYPKILDVFLPDGELLPLDQWVVLRALRGESDTNAEYTLQRKDTGETWIGSYNFSPFFDQQGNIAGSVVVARDISDRKKIEDAVRESEELLRVTLTNIQDPVFITDEKGHFTFVCPNVTNRLAFTTEEIKAMGNIAALLGDELFEAEKLETQGVIANIEKEVAAKTGSLLTFLITVKKVDIGAGKRLYTLRDISERKQATELLLNERAFLRSLIDSADDVIYFKDLNGCYLGCNKAAEKFIGIPESKQIGKTDFDFFDREIAERIVNQDQKVLASRAPLKIEESLPIPGSGNCIVDTVKAPIFGAEGQIVGLVGFSRDITDRRQAEEALNKSNEKLRLAYRIAKIGTWFLDPEIGVPEWSDEIYRIYERDPELGPYSLADYKKIYKGEWFEKFTSAIQGAMHEGQPYDIELKLELAPDNVKWVHAICEPEKNQEQKTYNLKGTIQDITERKRAEEKLSEIKADLQNTLDVSPGLICHANINTGFFTRSNPAVKDILGYSEEEFLGKPIMDFIHPDDRQMTIDEISKQLGGNPIANFHNRYLCKDGSYKWLSWGGTKAGKEGTVHAVATDITELKKAEEELRNSEERFRQLVENAPDAIFVRDKECFTYLNNAALTLFGADTAEDLIGTPIIERYHPKDRNKIRQRMSLLNNDRKAAPVTQSVCLRLDGTEVDVESTAVPIIFQGEASALIFLRNITERIEENNKRQELEEQLHQSQKIESLGRLAGGVAHDYNNMLSVIIGNVELAQIKAKRSAPVNDNLEHILEAANRSRDITRQLLAFARQQIINPKVIDLNGSVENMLKMLHNLLGENIDLRWLPREGVPPIKIDPSQLDQILANLCINARDAIADIGKMTIETGTARLDEDFCNDHPGFTPGDYVLLSVSDNGCGMDKETLANIFEPFFTTKEMGEGTGLGMATVYGIVKQSGGFINAYSEPNIGTTFNIYFPRYDGEEALPQQPTTIEIQKGQGETVLLVEDELAVLELTKAMLEDLGYRVLACNSPDQALTLLKKDQGEIHLLLTDVIMPQMNGRELAGQIMEICPNVKVLYMSGYTADFIAHHGVLDEGLNFIQKPFSRQELSMNIRDIFDSSS